jgi:hypothetical protein
MLAWQIIFYKHAYIKTILRENEVGFKNRNFFLLYATFTKDMYMYTNQQFIEIRLVFRIILFCKY